jgi:hypothetical protein
VTGSRIRLGTCRVNGTVVLEQLELALKGVAKSWRRTRDQIRFALLRLLFTIQVAEYAKRFAATSLVA